MFFKKKKISFDKPDPKKNKNTLNIICPNCGHEQTEPKKALSTNCRQCSTYFKIEKGQAVPPKAKDYYTNEKVDPTKAKESEKKQEKPSSGKSAPTIKKYSSKKEVKKEATEEAAVSNHTESNQKNTPQKTNLFRPSPIKVNKGEAKNTPKKEGPAKSELQEKLYSPTKDPKTSASSTSKLAFKPEFKETYEAPQPPPTTSEEELTGTTKKRYTPPPQVAAKENNSGLLGKIKGSGKTAPPIKSKDVSCFNCDRVHQAPAGASSTNCPECGTYITLKDYDIRGESNQRIKTRGNVTIHKKASVTGTTIICHNLTVIGKFTGGANCSGDLTLNSHSKVMNEVKCKRLIIAKKANIEFISHVYAEEIIIDGTATGSFTCSGNLQLKKKAVITGDTTVRTMSMEEGAKHNGRMSIGQ